MLANTENPVFTLTVGQSMSKPEIKNYLQKFLHVDAIKIKVVNKKAKTVKFRGITGKKSKSKKVFVTLKKGQKISELIVEKKEKKDKTKKAK